jgi:glycosyltransferase involved in cell wall biosynthesis
MKYNTFFSIIIATFNSEKVIANCLNSIINQKEYDYEILISDGGSTDKTVSIIQSYADNITHFRTSPDNGIYDAWNKVLPYVQGQWILFIGSDDQLYSFDSLQLAKQQIISQKVKTNYVTFPLIMTDSNTKLLMNRTKKRIIGLFKTGRMGLLHGSTFHNRTMFDEFGYFDSSFKIVGDLDFSLRTWRSGITVFDTPILTIFAIGGVSSNPKSRQLHYHEHKKVLIKHKYYSSLMLLLTKNAVYEVLIFFNLGKLLQLRRMLLNNISTWTTTTR